MIRSTYDPAISETEVDVLKPVIAADLLVLDHLGAEKTSEWVEATLNSIVNARYSQRRATVFTTNYEDKDTGTTRTRCSSALASGCARGSTNVRVPRSRGRRFP